MPKGQYQRKPRLADKAARLASEDVKVRAAARWPGMKHWQREFLMFWRASQDRSESISQAGMKIADLDAALDREQKFFDAYSEVEREITVALEDAQVKSAMTGKNSGAQKLALEAFSARYQKQSNAAKRGGEKVRGRVSGVKDWSARIEKKWGAIFESTRAPGHLIEANRAPSADT